MQLNKKQAKSGSKPAPKGQKRPVQTANSPRVVKAPPPAAKRASAPPPVKGKPTATRATPQGKPAALRPTAPAAHNRGSVTKGKPVALKRPSKQQRLEQQKQSREQFNKRIQTQTPSNRQAVRNQKRIKGSVKNLEIKSRTKTAKDRFHIKRKSSPWTGVFIIGVIFFIMIFTLLFGIVAAIVAIDLHIGSGVDPAAYTIQLGDELEKDYSNLVYMSEDESMRGNTLYIPVSALSEMCELTVTGITDDLRYIVRDSDNQTIRFIVGTDLAYVNECKVRMSNDSFISEGKLYVPLDFISEFSDGLSIDINEEDKLIVISRTVSGKDEYRRDIYDEFRFTMGKLAPLNRITVPIDMDSSLDVADENLNNNE